MNAITGGMKEEEGPCENVEMSKSNSGIIALWYLTHSLKLRRAFIKGVFFRALPHRHLEGAPGFIAVHDGERDRCGQIVANCTDQGNSSFLVLIKRLCLMTCTQ